MKIINKEITSPAGKLAVAIHYPKNTTEKLAVLCPGLLDTKDYDHMIGLAKELCRNGYTTARFDPTGTWESSGNITNYTNTQYLKDVETVINNMLKEKSFKNILLAGHSRGGQLAILYAARDKRVNTVVGIMPSSGPMRGPRRKAWESEGINISYRDIPKGQGQKKEFKVPFSHVLDGDKYNALKDIKKIKVPVILIAGELDELITPIKVKKLFDNANKPKKLVVIPKIGHDYRRYKNQISTVNKIILKALNNTN